MLRLGVGLRRPRGTHAARRPLVRVRIRVRVRVRIRVFRVRVGVFRVFRVRVTPRSDEKGARCIFSATYLRVSG